MHAVEIQILNLHRRCTQELGRRKKVALQININLLIKVFSIKTSRERSDLVVVGVSPVCMSNVCTTSTASLLASRGSKTAKVKRQ